MSFEEKTSLQGGKERRGYWRKLALSAAEKQRKGH